MRLLEEFLTAELKLPSPEEKLRYFGNYEKLLLEWNTKINLVSRKTASIETHIMNSIFFLTKYEMKGNERMIDIGTGGGFPGIPLKILYPDLKLTLLDSIKKKTTVLEDICRKLGFNDTEIICGRAEEVSEKEKYKNEFDIVIAKSVSTIANLYKWGKDFLKPDGKMILIKGGNIAEELSNFTKSYSNIKFKELNFTYDPRFTIEDKKIIIIH